MSQQINLLTPAFRPARRGAGAVFIAVVSLIIVIAAVGAAYERYRLRQAQAEAQRVSAQLKEAQARYEKVAAERGARQTDPAREARLLELTSQVKRRQDVISALRSGVLGTSGGFSGFMRAFSRQSLEGVWLTGFDVDVGGTELSLTGRALNADLVPRYIERLNRESLLQGRQFSSVRVDQRVEQRPAPSAPPPSKSGKAEKPPPAPPPIRYVEFSLSTVAREGGAALSSAAPAGGIADRITTDALGVRLNAPPAPSTTTAASAAAAPQPSPTTAVPPPRPPPAGSAEESK